MWAEFGSGWYGSRGTVSRGSSCFGRVRYGSQGTLWVARLGQAGFGWFGKAVEACLVW